METRFYPEKSEEDENKPLKKTRRSKRHKCELKPYKRQKFTYKEDVV